MTSARPPGHPTHSGRDPALNRALILGWGIGSFGGSALHNGIAFLALFYLSQVLGIPPAVAGSLILLAKIYDVVTDPFMGWLSDRTRSRWGRRRPWLLAGAVVSGLAFVLLFNPPAHGDTGRLIAAASALLLYATGYTLFNIPYLAMPAEMTGDYHDRSRLMSARTVCLSLGILAGGALAPALVGTFGGGAAGYARMSWIMGALIAASMLACFAGTRKARFTKRVATTPGSIAAGLGAQWRTAFANRPFMVLIASKFCHLIGVAVSMSSLVFLVTTVLDRGESAMGGFVLASAIGSIGSMPLWLAVSRRSGKRNAYLLGVACYLPVLLSWLLADPSEPALVFLARGLATGVATGGLTLNAQAMLPDTIEYDFRLSGLRREAMLSAIYSVAEKLASAGGPFLLGLVLTTADRGSAAAAAPGAGRAVMLAAVVIPAIATALSAVVLLFYELDRQMRPERNAAAGDDD